jgi:hypothetical protein
VPSRWAVQSLKLLSQASAERASNLNFEGELPLRQWLQVRGSVYYYPRTSLSMPVPVICLAAIALGLVH